MNTHSSPPYTHGQVLIEGFFLSLFSSGSPNRIYYIVLELLQFFESPVQGGLGKLGQIHCLDDGYMGVLEVFLHACQE